MKNKFYTLQPWIPQILSSIKKDIKTDHLPASPQFARAHFGNRPLNRLTTDEIFSAYEKDLLKGEDADLEEWVINHWVFQHGDIYDYFADALGSITTDYEELKNLTDDQSGPIMKEAAAKFGALPTYLFSVLNGVVFSEAIFENLRKMAQSEESQNREAEKRLEEAKTIDEMKERHERELGRLTEKYQGKIAGVMKKYTTEVEALKNQIRSLQKQLIAK